jgi:acyl carrier protein
MYNQSHQPIINKLIEKIKSDFNIKEELSGKSNLLELGLDSLDVMSFIFFIEDNFKVTISDDLLENKEFFVIDMIANYIEANQSQ